LFSDRPLRFVEPLRNVFLVEADLDRAIADIAARPDATIHTHCIGSNPTKERVQPVHWLES
jgi:hypothetical protein